MNYFQINDGICLTAFLINDIVFVQYPFFDSPNANFLGVKPRGSDDLVSGTRIGNVASILRRFTARTNTDEQSTHAN